MDEFLRHRKQHLVNCTVRVTQAQDEHLKQIANAVFGGNLSAATRDVLKVGLEAYAKARDKRNRHAA